MLEQRIKDDLKTSMKDGDKTSVSVLRMLISAIKNKQIEETTDKLDDATITVLIQKMVRQHKESVKQFKQGGREDLVEKETLEMKTLEKYLPEPISEAELEHIVTDAIDQTGAATMKDMGQVMKYVIDKTAGRADGKTVSQKVKERLSGSA